MEGGAEMRLLNLTPDLAREEVLPLARMPLEGFPNRRMALPPLVEPAETSPLLLKMASIAATAARSRAAEVPPLAPPIRFFPARLPPFPGGGNGMEMGLRME